MNPENEQIDVEVQRITYRNDENGWTVAKVCTNNTDHEFTITGTFTSAHQGQTFQLFGAWSKHPHYGRQFKVNRAVPIRPTTRSGVIKYLSSGLIKGVGAKTAEKIYDHFGKDTLEILDKESHRLIEIPSIGRKKLETIIAAWNEDKASNEIMMFLSNHGISPLFAHKILKLYGGDAIKLVSKDPYRLAEEIRGIGFKSADRIANQMGIAFDSPERIRAAINYQLSVAEDQGHCFASTEQLSSEMQRLLSIDEADLYPKLLDGLNMLNDSAQVISQNVVDAAGDNTSAHYRAKTLLAETNIGKNIARLLENKLEVDHQRLDSWLKRFCEAADISLSEQQLDAVKTAGQSRVFVLTGGPGVGKTTTANAIIRLFKAMGKTVALCAPTGRAAQRLTEVSSIQARTIHRLLEWAPHEGGFTFDENNPLTVQALIVDEASMLDINLADALLRATPSSAQIIFIGDTDQLPSVGPGNVLRDIIQSKKVPCRELNEIFRQAEASHIIQVAHSINRGVVPGFDVASDCKFLEIEEPDHIKGAIKALIKEKVPRECNFDPINDIQVLTPMNRGPLGTQTLNDEIQDLLNPKTPGKEEVQRGQVLLRTGDKVIQTVNNYDLAVFNGDIGVVEQCNIDGGKILVRFGERAIYYKNEQALELRLAYAITIHKSQGSEFPVVIIPVSTQHYVMLQRNLVYTGLTRAKKLAIFVGTRKAFSQAVHNQKSAKRQSLLLERIQQSCS